MMFVQLDDVFINLNNVCVIRVADDGDADHLEVHTVDGGMVLVKDECADTFMRYLIQLANQV